MKKLRGGIGALTGTSGRLLISHGGEVRLRTKVDEILVADGRVTGVRTEAGETLTAPIVVSGIAPDLTLNELVDPAALPADIRERYRADRPPRQLPADALRAGRGPRVRRALRGAQRSEPCRRRSASSAPRRRSSSSGRTAGAGSCPADPTVVLQIPSQNDPGPGARGQARRIGVRAVVPDRGRRRLRRRRRSKWASA